MKILSVDDNDENLYLIEIVGRAHGHEVVSAHNGREALDRLGLESFDLIVSDVLMPVMDGFQLCRIVKSDERLKQIPFIFYTATYTSKQDEDLGFALGASRFIIKPLAPADFLAAVEQVVRDGERGKIAVPVVDLDDDGKNLSLYNQRLVRKLERKIEQLEAARSELAASIEEKNREIVHRRQVEEALKRSEEKFTRAFLLNPVAIAIDDLSSTSCLDVNDAFEQLTGYRRDEVVGRRWDELGLWTDPSNRDEAVGRLQKVGSLRNWEFGFRKKNGDVGAGLLSAELIELEGHPCAISATMDITERLQLQNQLRQAQKLESIGRLAGGVAHDFNNLLTVITGYSGLLFEALDPADRRRLHVAEIGRAAERAAGLTQQLRAFSRKQVIAPKPLNLNNIVRDAERMLQRVIGEDIELVSILDPLLEEAMADASQIHQVIMNLVVNARDAMPQGGRLVIETKNVEVDEHALAEHPEAAPGAYVRLTVSDTGIGMTEEVIQNIFDPFFTTKGPGKGTGLGLSTVYGIVRQNGGWIDVSSTVGEGSAFRIYLPRSHADLVQESGESVVTTTDALHGDETLLVVEDEAGVRRLITTMLSTCGYHVFEAEDGPKAICAAENCSGEIHLLVTDVVLPGMNGKELSEVLRISRPKLKVLFTSGYTDDVIAPRGVLDRGVAYISKPFTRDELVAKIREVLSEGPVG